MVPDLAHAAGHVPGRLGQAPHSAPCAPFFDPFVLVAHQVELDACANSTIDQTSRADSLHPRLIPPGEADAPIHPRE